MTIDACSGSLHAFSDAERTAFVRHINDVLGTDADLQHAMPINDQNDDVFTVIRDGVLLWHAYCTS